ncbi:MAG: hypothetical protein HYX61_08870 [Gammaproteobacteria bacterium]|jgi:hypothetical protein|nr:hypothetical protein [Gammaproteobacteria bacterium]
MLNGTKKALADLAEKMNLKALNNKWVIGAGATAALATAPFVAGFTALTATAAAAATGAAAAVVGLGYGAAQVAPKAIASVKAFFGTKEADTIAGRLKQNRRVKFASVDTLNGKNLHEVRNGLRAKGKTAAPKRNDGETPLARFYNKSKGMFAKAVDGVKSFANSAFDTAKSYYNSTVAAVKSFAKAVFAKEQEVQNVVTSAVVSGVKSARDTGVSALNAGSKFVGSLFSHHQAKATKPAPRRHRDNGIDLANIIEEPRRRARA